MAVRSIDGDNIEKVANAIRTKGGLTQTLGFPDTMAAAIIGLKGASKCVSSLVEGLSYFGKRSIEIPIGDITKPQVISIVKVADTTIGDDTDMVLMLTIIMNSDGSTIMACSSISKNGSSGNYWIHDLNNDSFPSVTIDGNTLTVNTGDCVIDEFAYDYRCTVYGI